VGKLSAGGAEIHVEGISRHEGEWLMARMFRPAGYHLGREEWFQACTI
jgi:hypothetical protein